MPIPKDPPKRANAMMKRWAIQFRHTKVGEPIPRGVLQALEDEGWTGLELGEAAKHCLSQGWLESENNLALTEAGHDRFWY